MSKTKFINGQTPIQSDFLNKIFGGNTNIIINDLDDPDQIKTCFQVVKD